MTFTAKHLRQPLVLSVAIALSACGGGGGGVSSMQPPPVTPTPSPIEVGLYETAGVRSDQSDLPYILSSNAFGKGITIKYATPSRYTFVAPNSDTVAFSVDDNSHYIKPGYETDEYYKVSEGGSDFAYVVHLDRPEDSKVKLSHVMLTQWIHSSGLERNSYVAVAGNPTPATDIPKSGSASYNMTVIGSATRKPFTENISYTLDDNSSANLSIDFGSGAVSTQLQLRGVLLNSPDGTPSIYLMETSGKGNLIAGGPSYSGNFSTPGPGKFSGALFGPSASESAYAFEIFTDDLLASGFVFGTKK